DLNSLDKADEAKQILDRLAKQEPDDLKPLDALGNILRARKRYDEAADVYTRAIKLIPKPDKRHWSIYYSRGTCYERLKNWPAAEADLKKALELYPDQPLALNYLGYSWIDQNVNLKEGMSLIEKAVALKPDDGYIVDSLGWAHFKLGNYAEAVRFLERAVELKPQDPVLNDHLGDALWRVGREREAKFQWDQSLTLEPEPDEVEKIKKKLAEGLPPNLEAARTSQRETMRRAHQKRRKETKLNPALVE
ncbi:MAG TPA: tetratricopeptide repeat protein, partial [Hyphomicrobium sp.]|nr:tetratricopeptide repeat protein [Hyphomicrobium sp.]